MPDSFRPIQEQQQEQQPAQDSFRPAQIQQQQQPGWVSKYNGIIDFLRPFAGGTVGSLAAPLGAAAGTAVAPGPGTTAGAMTGETQGYALTDALMQHLKLYGPGQTPGLGETFNEAEKNAVINAVGTRILSTAFRGIKAFGDIATGSEVPEAYKLFPTSAQALQSFGHDKLASIARFAEDLGASGAKSEALDRVAGAGFVQQLRYQNLLNGRTAGVNANPDKLALAIKMALTDGVEEVPTPQSYKSWSSPFTKSPVNVPKYTISQEVADLYRDGADTFAQLDKNITDPEQLTKTLGAAQANGQVGLNVKQDLQAYQFGKMMREAATTDVNGNVTRYDPAKIQAAWRGGGDKQNAALDILYGVKGRDDTSEFLNALMSKQQPITDASGMMNYAQHRTAYNLALATGGIVLGGSAMAGHLAGELAGLGAIAGIYIPFSVLGRELTKPGTARILTAMANREPLGRLEQIGVKALWNSFQGATLAAVDSKGVQHPGTVVKDPQTGELKWANEK